jgi:hypothetical protein
MPIHNWSPMPAGLFHDFHQTWSIQIKIALNSGILPKGVSALVEQHAGPLEGDVLAIERWGARRLGTSSHRARPPARAAKAND